MYRHILITVNKIFIAMRRAKTTVSIGGGFAGTAVKAFRLYQREGLSGIRRGFQLVRRASDPSLTRYYSVPGLDQPVSRPAPQTLQTRVLLVAELSIAQCTKYRVTQKRDMLRGLGVDCTVASWSDARSCLGHLAVHSCVIFYRVPGFEPVLTLIAEAKRLRIPTMWEVDDLIFDRQLLAEAKSLQRLDREAHDGLLRGAKLYREAMLACDSGIASTSGLRQSMLNAGSPMVYVIENALDSATIAAATIANVKPSDTGSGTVRIVYGSGTSTHNVDFEEAADAILGVLERYRIVRLRIIGLLELPEAFSAHLDRIERIPFCDYDEYLQHLACCDINIAPLEPGEFNDAKSNIKYLEASSVKVPSVCSPRSAFRAAIRSGVNGILCNDTAEWESALSRLVEDKALRQRIGEAAYAHVMERYSPAYIAKHQLSLIIPPSVPRKRPRILSVNVYYAPRAFGGATIVAEEVNRQLAGCHDIDVYVFTTLPQDAAPAYGLRRYETEGIPVFGVALPFGIDEAMAFENPQVAASFAEVLAAVEPDLVHFHCLQNIGVTVADLCKEQSIPYVVTLHDAWWVCGRQFMVTRQGTPCGQTTIDVDVCAACVDNAGLNRYRQRTLGRALSGAAALFAPSSYFANFYRANGQPSDKILVNRNGIKTPEPRNKIKQSGPLRFGYVGGNVAVKGVELVRAAFRELSAANIALTVVDNALNLGMKSYPNNYFSGIPTATIVPAYSQTTIDAFFDEIDVLLFPTQAKESFGLVVREALARDVWVITTDAGGAVEDIIPGRNGMIIPLKATAADLCAAIRDTADFYEKIPAGTAIRLDRGTIINFEDQAAQLAPIYRQIILRHMPLPAQT